MYSGDTEAQPVCQKVQVQQNVFQMRKAADDRDQICKAVTEGDLKKKGRQVILELNLESCQIYK